LLPISVYAVIFPTVVNNPVTDITDTSAVLNGGLSDLGSATNPSLSFEYGTTNAYGSTVVGSPSDLWVPASFTGTLSGLSPGTTYHYRAIATEGELVGYSDDATFTTTGGGSAASTSLLWAIVPLEAAAIAIFVALIRMKSNGSVRAVLLTGAMLVMGVLLFLIIYNMLTAM